MNVMIQFFFFLVLVPSAIIHEYMHGWMADQLGDPTARYAGRLTLNPKSHIDPIGTILMPLILLLVSGGSFLFAYAKPVPYNPYNLKDGRWGPVWVALAGPASNFLLAAIFGALYQVVPDMGSLQDFLYVIVYANVLLGVFNLVPIPPLDGSKLLFALLPSTWQHIRVALERYSMVIFFAFIFFGVHLISPIMQFVLGIFTGKVGFF
ncbi:site-2 protease family protein [Patescibacteria group bacterium]|nr:site-2 protease family protein [Patescibacteria group bacterium]MBU1721565.1 site-2 protease family protein [Patescibacteria group bacterium]MBU1901457.1 site-2 protease family protein [Patescibacteria group bacterium]